MISIALLGFLQAILLPGLALVLWSTQNQKIAWPDKVLFATPLGIVVNYIAVSVLTWRGAYTQTVMAGIVLIELLAILGYFALHLPKGDFQIQARYPLEIRLDSQALLKCCAILPLFLIYARNPWNVFIEWDAVVSWNRWAKEWFYQQPGPSMGYPPGLPILYSIVYKLSDTLNIQTMARNVAAYFPFFGLFCIWRIGHHSSSLRRCSLIAGVFYAYLLPRGYGGRGFTFGGYTDPLIASLSAFSLYALTVLRHLPQAAEQRIPFHTIALFGLSLVAAAIVKQNGAFLAAITVGCALLLTRRYLRTHFLEIAGIVLFAAAWTGHWYVYSYFHFHDFAIASSLLPDNLWVRVWQALLQTARICGIPLTVLFLVAIARRPTSRPVAFFFALPLWVFWGLLVSYDFRSAYYLVPVVALIAAAGAEHVIDHLFPDSTVQISCNLAKRRAAFVILAIASALLLLAPYIYPSNKALLSNDKLRLNSNERGFNAEMVSLFSRSSGSEKTMSCWQMLYNLPGAYGKFTPLADCVTGHKIWLDAPDVKYFLYWEKPVAAPNSVQDVRDAARAASLEYSERELAKGFILFEKLGAPDSSR